MPEFALFTDKMGVREDVPKALLSEVFIADESRNFHEEFGEWRKLKGRIPLVYDADGVKIKAPQAYYPITVVSTGDKKFTVAGTVKADIDAATVDDEIRVNGSTGNDALYTVVSVTENGGNTEIVVSETIADATADGNLFVGQTPILCTHTYTKQSTQVDYLLLATAYHVWLWNDTTKILTLKFTSASPTNVEEIYMVTHLDVVYFTNNVDKIQWWDTSSTSNSFENAGGASGIPVDGDEDTAGNTFIIACQYLHSYESFLFLGAITYNNNAIFKQRAVWASRGTVGDDIDFNLNGEGDCGYKDFNRESSILTGFASKGNDLIVAKGERMVKGWLVTEDTVFQWEEEYVKVGNVSGKSLVNDRAGRLYWFASDLTLREIDTPDPISMFVGKTMRNLNPSKLSQVQATYIDEYSEIWFALPSQSSDTNDLVFAYNVITAKSFFYELPIRAFGDYRRQVVYGYDTFPDGIDTYEEWGAGWLLYDTKVNTVGYPLDLATDYDGGCFELHGGTNDDGVAFTGSLVVSTTLTAPKSPHLFKRIVAGLDAVFNKKSAGTFTLKVKRDTETSWTSLGTVNLVGMTKVVYGDNLVPECKPFVEASLDEVGDGWAIQSGKAVYTGHATPGDLQKYVVLATGTYRVKCKVSRASFTTGKGVELYVGTELIETITEKGIIDTEVTLSTEGAGVSFVGTETDTTKGAVIDYLIVQRKTTPEQAVEVLWEHTPFNKRAKVFYFKIESTGDLELLGLFFKEFSFDGDR